MSSHLQLIPGSIAEILASSRETGCITKSDRYGLLAATLDESLDQEDREAVNRLLYAIRRGKIQIID